MLPLFIPMLMYVNAQRKARKTTSATVDRSSGFLPVEGGRDRRNDILFSAFLVE